MRSVNGLQNAVEAVAETNSSAVVVAAAVVYAHADRSGVVGCTVHL